MQQQMAMLMGMPRQRMTPMTMAAMMPFVIVVTAAARPAKQLLSQLQGMLAVVTEELTVET